MNKTIFLYAFFFLASASSWSFGSVPKMGPEYMSKLAQGKQVVELKDRAGPWPEITIYSLVGASPLEAVSVFAAYNHQKDYIPNMKESKVIKQISPVEVHTKYTMNMPWPFPDSTYVHGSKIIKTGKHSYRVTWWLVQSNDTKKVQGQADFLPSPEKGKTLFRYKSYVEPTSILANLVESKMLEDVKKSVKSILTHTQKVRKQRPKTLEGFVQNVLKSLDGEKVFSNN